MFYSPAADTDFGFYSLLFLNTYKIDDYLGGMTIFSNITKCVSKNNHLLYL